MITVTLTCILLWDIYKIYVIQDLYNWCVLLAILLSVISITIEILVHTEERFKLSYVLGSISHVVLISQVYSHPSLYKA